MAQFDGVPVRPHLAEQLRQASHLLIGFNTIVGDLRWPGADQSSRKLFEYMFDRGERFPVLVAVADLHEMVEIAVKRGYSQIGLDLLDQAEHRAIEDVGLALGVTEVLQACRSTDRRVGVVSGLATATVDKVLTRLGVQTNLHTVVGRQAAEPPSLRTTAERLAAGSGRVVFVGDRHQGLAWAKQDGLDCIGVVGHSRRKDLAHHGPVIASMTRLAAAIHAIPVSWRHS